MFILSKFKSLIHEINLILIYIYWYWIHKKMYIIIKGLTKILIDSIPEKWTTNPVIARHDHTAMCLDVINVVDTYSGENRTIRVLATNKGIWILNQLIENRIKSNWIR